jgi:hypothetical protein
LAIDGPFAQPNGLFNKVKIISHIGVITDNRIKLIPKFRKMERELPRNKICYKVAIHARITEGKKAE